MKWTEYITEWDRLTWPFSILVFLLSGLLAAAEPDSPSRTIYTQSIPEFDMTFDMLPIPAGSLTMGSPKTETGRSEDEGPRFEVIIEPFWMGKFEVTWDEYQKFRDEYRIDAAEVLNKAKEWQTERWADAVSVPTPLWEQDSAPVLNGMGYEGGYPAVDISNYAARQYTKWLSKKTGRFYRLPTEAEWEYAARAGSTTAFSYGDDVERLEDYAWFFDNSQYDDDRGHPDYGAGYRKVGQKKPNAWGLYDMHGNVSEWVIDAYLPNHYGSLAGKSISWKEAVAWPKSVFPRVARGGNWNSDAADCRAAARLASHRSWQKRDPQLPKSIWWYTDAFHVGFRVVRPVKEPPLEEKLKFWDADTEKEKFVIKTNDKIIRLVIDQDPKAKP